MTNDAWAPLRAPRLTLARAGQGAAPPAPAAARRAGALSARSRFGRRQRSGAAVAGAGPLVADGRDLRRRRGGRRRRAPERRRALAELLLERYGIVTREQVLAENIRGGFASLYDTFDNLETLGVCRRGYFIEGMGGAQFALPGAVERLRAAAPLASPTLVIAATDPAQPYGAALPWPKREREQGRPARVAGAYLVLVERAARAVPGARRAQPADADRAATTGGVDRALRRARRAAAGRAGGARRGGPRGQAAAALAGADRRRAGDGQPAGRAAGRARLPLRTAAADAERMSEELRSRPRRVGHKGAAHIEPGNTLASFDAALRHDVDMIELDVLSEHTDGSGSLLVAHDYEDMHSRVPRQPAGRARAPVRAELRRDRTRRRHQAARV